MWIYEKKLEFPVKITQPDARLAKIMMGWQEEIAAEPLPKGPRRSFFAVFFIHLE